MTYEYNVLGTRGPRKMKGFIPRVDVTSGERARFVATTRDGAHGILDCHKHGRRDDLIVLTNKSPRWNEQMQAYCLNFNGRVTHARASRTFSSWTSAMKTNASCCSSARLARTCSGTFGGR